MNKYILSTLVISMFFAVVSVQQVFAGGCCYKSISTVDGIAGKQAGEVKAVLIDKVKLMTPPDYPIVGLANAKVAIHIISPKPGQQCVLKNEKTDGEGAAEASCTSPVPGVMQVYFTSEGWDQETNNSMAWVPKDIIFQVNPDATPTPTPTPTTTPTATPTATPTSTPTATPVVESPETIKLKQKVAELEKKVEKQQKEVNRLQSTLDKVMSFFRRFFR